MSQGPEPEKLSITLRIAFGMGNMLNVLGVVGMWFPYAPTFFNKVLGIPQNEAGTILLVAQVAGGVFSLTVGILSDACRCPIYGRRKALHLFGTVAFLCSFFFLWHDCFGCRLNYRTLYYSIIAVVFQLGYAATQISQLALVPELAPNKHMKVELNSIRFGFQAGGTILVYVLLLVLLIKLPPGGTSYTNSTLISDNCTSGGQVSVLNSCDMKAFWVLAIIVLGLGFLMVIPFHVVVREKSVILKKLKWYQWFLKPNFYLVICIFVAAKIITIFTQQYLPYYFLDTLKMNKWSVTIGPLVLYIAMFCSTVCVKKVNKLVGEKMLYFIGVAFVWGALMWLWVEPAYPDHGNFYWNRDRIYIAIILLGIGGATLMVLSLSMVSILIGEFSGSSAYVYGWVLLVDRVSNGLLNKLVMGLQGKFAGPGERLYYRHVIVFTPLAATVFGLASIGLLAVWELYQHRKLKAMLEKEDANVQIGGTVADDKVSLYSVSMKALDRFCCATCRHEPTFEVQGSERQALIESYHEQLNSSAKHEPVDYDLEFTLST